METELKKKESSISVSICYKIPSNLKIIFVLILLVVLELLSQCNFIIKIWSQLNGLFAKCNLNNYVMLFIIIFIVFWAFKNVITRIIKKFLLLKPSQYIHLISLFLLAQIIVVYCCSPIKTFFSLAIIWALSVYIFSFILLKVFSLFAPVQHSYRDKRIEFNKWYLSFIYSGIMSVFIFNTFVILFWENGLKGFFFPTQYYFEVKPFSSNMSEQSIGLNDFDVYIDTVKKKAKVTNRGYYVEFNDRGMHHVIGVLHKNSYHDSVKFQNEMKSIIHDKNSFRNLLSGKKNFLNHDWVFHRLIRYDNYQQNKNEVFYITNTDTSNNRKQANSSHNVEDNLILIVEPQICESIQLENKAAYNRLKFKTSVGFAEKIETSSSDDKKVIDVFTKEIQNKIESYYNIIFPDFQFQYWGTKANKVTETNIHNLAKMTRSTAIISSFSTKNDPVDSTKKEYEISVCLEQGIFISPQRLQWKKQCSSFQEMEEKLNYEFLPLVLAYTSLISAEKERKIDKVEDCLESLFDQLKRTPNGSDTLNVFDFDFDDWESNFKMAASIKRLKKQSESSLIKTVPHERLLERALRQYPEKLEFEDMCNSLIDRIYKQIESDKDPLSIEDIKIIIDVFDLYIIDNKYQPFADKIKTKSSELLDKILPVVKLNNDLRNSYAKLLHFKFAVTSKKTESDLEPFINFWRNDATTFAVDSLFLDACYQEAGQGVRQGSTPHKTLMNVLIPFEKYLPVKK